MKGTKPWNLHTMLTYTQRVVFDGQYKETKDRVTIASGLSAAWKITTPAPPTTIRQLERNVTGVDGGNLLYELFAFPTSHVVSATPVLIPPINSTATIERLTSLDTTGALLLSFDYVPVTDGVGNNSSGMDISDLIGRTLFPSFEFFARITNNSPKNRLVTLYYGYEEDLGN